MVVQFIYILGILTDRWYFALSGGHDPDTWKVKNYVTKGLCLLGFSPLFTAN